MDHEEIGCHEAQLARDRVHWRDLGKHGYGPLNLIRGLKFIENFRKLWVIKMEFATWNQCLD